jgi:hypothetical protein
VARSTSTLTNFDDGYPSAFPSAEHACLLSMTRDDRYPGIAP